VLAHKAGQEDWCQFGVLSAAPPNQRFKDKERSLNPGKGL